MSAMIQSLPDPTREILRLRLAGRTVAQIATQLGLTELVVSQTLKVGLIELRGLFHDYQRRLLAG
jgi:hypothetical protein